MKIIREHIPIGRENAVTRRQPQLREKVKAAPDKDIILL